MHSQQLAGAAEASGEQAMFWGTVIGNAFWVQVFLIPSL